QGVAAPGGGGRPSVPVHPPPRGGRGGDQLRRALPQRLALAASPASGQVGRAGAAHRGGGGPAGRAEGRGGARGGGRGRGRCGVAWGRVSGGGGGGGVGGRLAGVAG